VPVVCLRAALLALAAACCSPRIATAQPACLSPVPAEVWPGPRFSGSLAEPDVPIATVASPSRLAAGKPATLHVTLTAPATIGGKPVDASYEGFNPEYPNRLTPESQLGTFETGRMTATRSGATPGATWSAKMLAFDLRFTPSATPSPGARVPFVAQLRFGLCNDRTCTAESVTLKWSLPAAGTEGARGARVTVTHDFPRSRPDDPHRHVWAALVPVSAYPADDTCILFDLGSIALGQAAFSTRNRDELVPYAACSSTSAIELRAPPGDYYLVAGAAGWGWWMNGTIRKKLTIGSKDVAVHLTDADRNQDNCGD
jgi:hypothetical protein